MDLKRIICLVPLLALLAGCVGGVAHVAPVTPDAGVDQVVMMEPKAPPVPPVLPLMAEAAEAPSVDPFAMVEAPDPVETDPVNPKYIVHVGVSAVENGNDEYYNEELALCFQEFPQLTDVQVVYDLNRDLAPEEIEAFELEGFDEVGTGCAVNLFTMLSTDGEE